MSPEHFVEWLDKTQWSVALHESVFVYPIVESIHVLTLCLFLGLAFLLDLRLLGITLKRVPVAELADRFLPYTITGFVIMVATGIVLFYGIPIRTYHNVFFRAKVLMLILAGINIWTFHAGVYTRVGEWGADSKPPLRARMAGMFSLILWAGIVVAGRMIAYNWFDKPA